MAVMIDVEYVRKLGNIPDEVPDSVIEPHVESAVREVEAMFPSGYPEGKEEDIKEVMGCFAMSEVVKVLHTFYVEGAGRVGKMVNETQMVFMNPGDVERVARQWRRRAERILERLALKRMKAEVV